MMPLSEDAAWELKASVSEMGPSRSGTAVVAGVANLIVVPVDVCNKQRVFGKM